MGLHKSFCSVSIALNGCVVRKNNMILGGALSCLLLPALAWASGADVFFTPQPYPSPITIYQTPSRSRQVDYIARSSLQRTAKAADRYLSASRRSTGTYAAPNTELLCRAYFEPSSNRSSIPFTAVGELALATSTYLSKQLNLQNTFDQTVSYLDLRSYLNNKCPRVYVAPCSDRRVKLTFREPNGECNNVQNARWGTSGRPLGRILYAHYADGVGQPRYGPSPREITLKLFRSNVVNYRVNTVDPHNTNLMFVSFAHFMKSDLVRLTQSIELNPRNYGDPNPCLECAGYSQQQIPNCFPIPVPYGDPAFKPIRQLPYTRLQLAFRDYCRLGRREIQNLATSYFDGEQIYGPDAYTQNRLRAFHDGELRTSRAPYIHQESMPPNVPTQSQHLCRNDNKTHCYDFGDYSSNYLTMTAAHHLMWIREHNRIAAGLKYVNEHWDDERLFQEAKRILLAEYQYIMYNEMVPLLIGHELWYKARLTPESAGYSGDYDPNLEAQTFAAFALAAADFFQVQIPNRVTISQRPGEGTRSLEESVYNPGYFLPISGEVTQEMLSTTASALSLDSAPIDLVDRFLTSTTSGTYQANTGTDLFATIIQMGRDGGLASYKTWHEKCGLGYVNSFDDLRRIINYETLAKLRTAYRSVDEIDLFVGGLAESAVSGGILGPTFTCIFITQMQRSRFADRHWHESFTAPSALKESNEQLIQIRATSMARILCDNAKLRFVQPKAFLLADKFENAPIICDGANTATGTGIPALDFEAWRDSEPVPSLNITRTTIYRAVQLGLRMAGEFLQDEQSKMARQRPVRRRSAVYFHSMFLPATKYAMAVSQASCPYLQCSNVLVNRIGMARGDIPLELDARSLSRLLPRVETENVLGTIPENECIVKTIPCDPTSKYRTISGWCNNIHHPKYGSSHVVLRREVAPIYDDSFNSPRSKSVTGQYLPSPRLVSLRVHSNIGPAHSVYTALVMQWGQLLDHEMTLVPMSRKSAEEPLDCSDCNSHYDVSANCFPIPVPANDPMFPLYTRDRPPRRRCLPFARSSLAMLNLGYREQMNVITSYLDGSSLYGSEDCNAANLRAYQGGLLKYSLAPKGRGQRGSASGESYLPVDVNGTNGECKETVEERGRGICFSAGDVRGNEHHGLGGIHIMLLREHNRIARTLYTINPRWNDERIYQETRRIIGAMEQHITYNEWLPIVLGSSIMERFNLNLIRSGFYNYYTPNCDASISNVFSAAGFRFGHSLVDDVFKLKTAASDAPDAEVGEVELKDIFFKSEDLYRPDYLNMLTTGMCSHQSLDMDEFIVDTLRNRLFEEENHPFSGMDLAALNIQRARDHGLPGYVAYREHYDILPKIKTFGDLTMIMKNATVASLQSVYADVRDIDIFTGMTAENRLPEALVSETNGRILGEQFLRLRGCDRFWPTGTNPSCYDGQTSVPSRYIHEQRSTKGVPNKPVPCDVLPDIDLNEWRDREVCELGGQYVQMGHSMKISPCVSCTCTAIGPRCESYYIRDCSSLLGEYSLAAIRQDRACIVQCSNILSGSYTPTYGHGTSTQSTTTAGASPRRVITARRTAAPSRSYTG